MNVLDKIKIVTCEHPQGAKFVGRTGVIVSLIKGNTVKYYRVQLDDDVFVFMAEEMVLV